MIAGFRFQTTNTILYCRKWDKTVAFYREILGLPVLFESGWFVEFALSETARLSIADDRRSSVKSAGGAGITLTFQVSGPLEPVRELLVEKGYAPGPVRPHAWGAEVFYLNDPEGCRLEFWKSVSPDADS